MVISIPLITTILNSFAQSEGETFVVKLTELIVEKE
jgi:hypothetical protein